VIESRLRNIAPQKERMEQLHDTTTQLEIPRGPMAPVNPAIPVPQSWTMRQLADSGHLRTRDNMKLGPYGLSQVDPTKSAGFDIYIPNPEDNFTGLHPYQMAFAISSPDERPVYIYWGQQDLGYALNHAAPRPGGAWVEVGPVVVGRIGKYNAGIRMQILANKMPEIIHEIRFVPWYKTDKEEFLRLQPYDYDNQPPLAPWVER
jgi:hypothetical protein